MPQTFDDYFKALVNSLPDMVWSFDKHFILTAANTSFFELRKELYQTDIKIGDNFFKGVSQSATEKWLPSFNRVLKGERLILSEERHIHGRTMVVELSLNPVLNEEGEVTGCMGITYDVTKTFELEAKVAQLLKVIDHLVKTSDSKILPSITKVFALSQEISGTKKIDQEDYETIVYLVNNELVHLNKELGNLISITKGAKNL